MEQNWAFIIFKKLTTLTLQEGWIFKKIQVIERLVFINWQLRGALECPILACVNMYLFIDNKFTKSLMSLNLQLLNLCLRYHNLTATKRLTLCNYMSPTTSFLALETTTRARVLQFTSFRYIFNSNAILMHFFD